MRKNPYVYGMGLWLGLVLVCLGVATWQVPLSFLLQLILALNAGTFLLYGLDKLFAMSRGFRIPERVLWFAACAGGPLGAILGMNVFRHKTSKTSFQFVLALLLLLELIVVGLVLQRAGFTLPLFN